MDLRRVTVPRMCKRSRSSGTSRRMGPLLGAVVAAALVVAAMLAGGVAGGPEAVAVSAAIPPGLQPPVQAWFEGREDDVIELNDALVPLVQKRVKDPAAARAACSRLSKVSRALSARSAVPGPRPEINTAARAGLAKFVQAASACLAGDVPTAERLVSEGLAERTAAQQQLDELLDNE
jgi:hypothetical protein